MAPGDGSGLSGSTENVEEAKMFHSLCCHRFIKCSCSIGGRTKPSGKPAVAYPPQRSKVFDHSGFKNEERRRLA